MTNRDVIRAVAWTFLISWVVALAAMCLALALTQDAEAFEDQFWGAPAEHRKPIKKRHKPKPKPQVRGWVKTLPPPVEVAPPVDLQEAALGAGRCWYPVVVVGSQRPTESDALDSATKAWMEEVRFAIGEAAMDIDNSKDRAHICSRSSIGEILNATMHRCRLVATPCRPTLVKGPAQ